MSISTIPSVQQQAPHAPPKTTTVAHDKIQRQPTEQLEKRQLAQNEKRSVDIKV